MVEKPTRRWVRTWVEGAARQARYIVAFCLFCSLVAILVLRSIPAKGMEELLSPETRMHLGVLDAEFPLPDDLVIFVRGGVPREREAFVSDLDRRLATRPQFFPDRLYKLQLEPIRKHLLLFMESKQLKLLADGMERLRPRLTSGASLLTWVSGEQPAAGGAANDLSMVYVRLFEATLHSAGRAPWITPLQSLLPPSLWQFVRPFWVGDKEMFLTLENGRAHVMLVRAAGSEAVSTLRDWLRDARRRNPALEVELTGNQAIFNDQGDALKRQLLPTIGLTGLMLVLASAAGLLDHRRALAATLALAAGMLTGAAMSAVFLGLGPIWLTAQTLALAVMGYLALHLCVDPDYHHVYRVGNTAVFGFGALALSPLPAAAALGGATAVSCFVTTVVLLTLMPALGSLGLKGAETEDALWLAHTWPAGRRPTRTILALTAVAAVFSISLVPWTRFSADPLEAMDPTAPSLRTERERQGSGRSSLYALALVKDLETARKLGDRLKKQPYVDEIFSLANFLPQHDAQKARAIERIAAIAKEARTPQAIRLASAADLLALARSAPPGPTEGNWSKVLSRMGPGAIQDALQHFQKHLLEDYDRMVAILRVQESGPVNIKDLPAGAVQRLVGRTGKIAVMVFPRLQPGTGLEDFVDQLSKDVKDLGGPAVLAADLGKTTRVAVHSLFLALLLGTLCSLTYLLRSPVAAFLILLGPALALLFTLQVLAFHNLSLNFLTWPTPGVLAIWGVSLAFTALRRPRAKLRAFFPAVVVLFVCLPLVTGSHPGLAGLGTVLALGMGFNLFIAVVVLPAAQVFLAARNRGTKS